MNKKIVTGVVVSIATIVLVAGVVAVASGTVRLAWKDKDATTSPNGTDSASVIVCDNSLVRSYNDAREIKVRDSGEASADTAGLKAIAETIKKSQHYENDPTCQTILFWTAYFDKDHEAAKIAYDALRSLHEQRVFADTDTLGVTSMDNYKAAVDSLLPANTNTGTNGD